MTTPIYDAVLFDLDGVLTATAALHAECWKLTFDPVLAHHGQRHRSTSSATTSTASTASRAHDGVRDFLLPHAASTAAPRACALIADRKQALVERALAAAASRPSRAPCAGSATCASAAYARPWCPRARTRDAVLCAAGIDDLFESRSTGATSRASDCRQART